MLPGLMLQPLPSWLIHPAASGRSLLGTPTVGLGPFSVRSRLTNEFVLLGPLGQGGGGAVFRARNRLDGREYALKRVCSQSTQALHAVAQRSAVAFGVQVSFSVCPGEEAVGSAADVVLREVQALARLNHRSVCRCTALCFRMSGCSYLTRLW